jgi:hypothetical protein
LIGEGQCSIAREEVIKIIIEDAGLINDEVIKIINDDAHWTSK